MKGAGALRAGRNSLELAPLAVVDESADDDDGDTGRGNGNSRPCVSTRVVGIATSAEAGTQQN